MNHIDLIGSSAEEIDKFLLNTHQAVFNYLTKFKEGKISWNYLNPIQKVLMAATGYTTKKVDQVNEGVMVTFEEYALSPNNNLTGKGKNELEAICNACENLFENPYEYNTFSIKYVNQIKNKKIK